MNKMTLNIPSDLRAVMPAGGSGLTREELRRVSSLVEYRRFHDSTLTHPKLVELSGISLGTVRNILKTRQGSRASAEALGRAIDDEKKIAEILAGAHATIDVVDAAGVTWRLQRLSEKELV